MELTEFLLARIAEEEDAHRAWFLADVPSDQLAEATAAWDRLTATALLRLSIALRSMGWSLLDTYGLRKPLRKKAREYADHPDYDPAWRP